MKNNNTKHTSPLLAALLLAGVTLLGTGCSKDRVRTDDSADRTADKMNNNMSDAATTTAVKSKLAADVHLATLTGINVDSNGHTVTLSGSVPTAADKDKAEATAKSVDGVTAVINNLEVKP